jgi:branched-chain amino acid transport system substrate-binding protein
MTRLAVAPLAAALAVLVAACGSGSGGSSSSSSSGGAKSCAASVGVMAPITGDAAQQGTEQLHFAQLAIQQYNQAHKTHFKIVQGDTQLDPGQASTVAQQFTSNDKIVGIVGPAGSQEVEAIGPVLARVKMAMVSQSATNGALTTSGKYPGFYRVVPPDTVQGPTDADFIANRLHAKQVFLVDDQTSYSTGLADSVVAKLKGAGVAVTRESVSQKSTDFSALVSKIGAGTDVVFLPWQLAANAQQFGQQMAEQGKQATIFGTDGLFSPKDFKIAGSYVSSFSPDINDVPSAANVVKAFKAQYGQFGTFGPPTYAAATTLAAAIDAVCKSGKDPSREAVRDQLAKTNLPGSILGQPIKFTRQGDLEGAKFFIFKVTSGGFQLVKGQG